jgi:GT2 family glycosyltransferase
MASPADQVTLVVLTRDRVEVLLDTLARLVALPGSPPILVVDDASQDGSARRVAERFGDRVVVIPLPRSVGGAGRNVGVRAARTPYVAFSDDDSWWAPGALERAVAVLQAEPRLAVVQGHILVGPGERDDPICSEMAASPLPSGRGQPGHPLLSFVACAVVCRRSALLAAGGFLAALRMGGEEELLGQDLAAGGWHMSYLPDVVAHHHPGPRDGRKRRRDGIRNALWTTWLRRPVGPAARRTLRLLRRCPPDATTARAVGEALLGAPLIVRRRRPLPPDVERLAALLEVQQLNSEARRYVD